MKIADILRRKGSDLVTIRPYASIEMAAGVMTAKGIGALIVLDDSGHLAGIISERDIVHGFARHKGQMDRSRVADLMIREVITCRPDDSVKHIMAVISDRRVRHVPVMDNGKLAGIVSIGDVLKSRLDETMEEVNVLRDLSLSRG
jgi:CBS domain-containing protein